MVQMLDHGFYAHTFIVTKSTRLQASVSTEVDLKVGMWRGWWHLILFPPEQCLPDSNLTRRGRRTPVWEQASGQMVHLTSWRTEWVFIVGLGLGTKPEKGRKRAQMSCLLTPSPACPQGPAQIPPFVWWLPGSPTLCPQLEELFLSLKVRGWLSWHLTLPVLFSVDLYLPSLYSPKF